MRKSLLLALVIALLIPSSALAKEDKKPTVTNNANSNSNSQANNSKGTNSTGNSNSGAGSQGVGQGSPNNNSSNSNQSSGTTSATNANGNTNQNSNNSNNGNSQSNNNGSAGNSNKPINAASNNGNQNANSANNSAANNGKANSKKPANAGIKNLKLKEGESKEFVVRFRDDTSIATEATNLRAQKFKISRTFNNVFKGMKATLNAKQLEALLKNPKVEEIEEDIEVTTTVTQSGVVWGLDRIDQRALPLNSEFSYIASSTAVRAYVIDTGIKSSHQDFIGRVPSGYTAISDGRGTDDCNGHGTHVAGTIGGSKYGVSKSTLLIPVRVLGCDGSGTLSGVIAGLDWIAANNPSGTPAVANMSLGAGASSTLDSAVNNLINRGITVVVAAGNSSASACDFSPARVPAAITVAASNINDQLSGFSNNGNCVDVIAPGESIVSTWNSSDTAIATLSGTSMASPHVAGAVALILSNGYQSPSALDNLIKTNATTNVISALPTGTPNLLLFTNQDSSVITPKPIFTVPTAPTNVVATAIKRAAEISWVLPESNGGTPITSQVINVYNNGNIVKTMKLDPTLTFATIRTLNPKFTYSFAIYAVNSVGNGPISNMSNTVTPLK